MTTNQNPQIHDMAERHARERALTPASKRTEEAQKRLHSNSGPGSKKDFTDKEWYDAMRAQNHPWVKDWDRERDVPQGNFDRGDEASDVASLDPTRPSEAQKQIVPNDVLKSFDMYKEAEKRFNEAINVWREAYVRAVGDREAYKSHADKLAGALRDIVSAADDPDNEKDRDLVEAIDFKGIRAALAAYEEGASSVARGDL